MSRSSQSNPYIQAGSYTPRSRGKSCFRCGCILFVALIALLIIGLVGLRTYLIQRLGQDRIDQLASYDTEIIKIPEDWQESAKLPSDEVVDFQLKFYNQIGAIGEQFNGPLYDGPSTGTLYNKIHNGETLTPDEQQTVNQLVAAMKPIIAETSAALSLPDYTADMFLYTTGTQFLQVQNFAKYTAVVALETARDGDCTAAMDLAALPMRYLDYEKPASLIYELIRVAVIHISTATIESIANQCDDAASLRHGLDLMNQYRDQAKPLSRDEWELTDPVSILNRVRAFGYPVEPGPQTRTHLMQQMGDVFGKPYNAWAVEHFPDDDPRHRTARGKLDSMRDSSPQKSDWFSQAMERAEDGLNKLSASKPSRKFFGFNPAALLVDVAIPNFEEAATRGDTMFAIYDLTRLHLAQRILELQTTGQGTTPDGNTTGTSTITELIQSIPDDPFSDETLRFRNEANQFYSVGPDGDDDDQSIPYDATNGTVSGGDIFIKR